MLPILPLALAITAWPGPSRAEAPLTLTELVDRARSNDLRVKEADANLRVLRGKYDEARWAWFPRIEASVMVAGPTPEAQNDGLGGPPLSEATKMYDLNFGHAGVMLGADAYGFLPLYTFGKLDALKDAAAQGLIIGDRLRARAKDEAGLQAAQAFFGYQLARQSRRTLDETLTRLDDATATLKRLTEKESPQVTQMDLLKLDFFRKQVEARAGAIDSGLGYALAAAHLLCGGVPGKPVELAAVDLAEPTATLKPLETYLALAYEHRPELMAVEAGLAARAKEVFIRERLFYPDFGVAGFARWRWTTTSTRQLSPFANDPYNDASAGMALVGRATFDVFTKDAQLDQSRAELEKLSTQRDLLRAGIHLEAEKAYGELSDALVRSRAQGAAERSARRWATSASAAFDLGTGDTRELVDAFTAFAAASAEKLRAWHDYHVGVHVFGRVLGAPMEGIPAPAKARVPSQRP